MSVCCRNSRARARRNTIGEIDDAIRFVAGVRHFMQQFGPALELPWTKLVVPKLTDELIDRVVDSTAEQVGPRSIKQLERYRDDCIARVLQAIAEAKARHGFLPAE